MKLSKETALYEKDAIKNGINNAAGTATKYVTLIDDDTGIFVSPEGEGPKDKPNTKTGWSISDAIELFKNGVSYIKAWINTQNKPEIRIGQETGGNIVVDDDSIDICEAGDILSTFSANGASIGCNGIQSVIDFCNGHLQLSCERASDNIHYKSIIDAPGDGNYIGLYSDYIELVDSISPRVQPYRAIGPIALTTAGISYYAQGDVELFVDPGFYLLVGHCTFPSLSATGGRHNSIRLRGCKNETGSIPYTITSGYSVEGDRWTSTIDVVYITTIDEPSIITLEASSSKIPASNCEGHLMAVRLL